MSWTSADEVGAPTYVHKGQSSWVCDNYMIEANGPGERLHHFPEEVVELG